MVGVISADVSRDLYAAGHLISLTCLVVVNFRRLKDENVESIYLDRLEKSMGKKVSLEDQVAPPW